MARIRTIKPEFWADEDLSALPAETHLLAAALLNHADDEGYFKAHPRLVESACKPLREDSTSVRRSLDELSSVGYIDLYEGTDGKAYGHVRNFTKHQKVDRPQASKIRPIISHLQDFDESSTNDRRTLDEGSSLEQGTGNREQGQSPKPHAPKAVILEQKAPAHDRRERTQEASGSPTISRSPTSGSPSPPISACHRIRHASSSTSSPTIGRPAAARTPASSIGTPPGATGAAEPSSSDSSDMAVMDSTRSPGPI